MPIILIGILFFPAYTTASQPCDTENSVYCDASWRGMSSIYQNARMETVIERAFSGIGEGNHVYVWVNPPQITAEQMRQHLSKGAKFLVFDESATSLEWYRTFFEREAESVDSPNIREAGHINGNPNLPVFQADDELIARFRLPPAIAGLHIAFNHPSPIVLRTDESDRHKAIFSYAFHDGSGGAVFVVRDESFLTNLMQNTVDNRRFTESLIDVLCGESCMVHFVEPDFAYSAAAESEPKLAERGFMQKTSAYLDNIREKFCETAEQIRGSVSEQQRFLIAFLVISLWAIIAFVAAFSWGRTKQ